MWNWSHEGQEAALWWRGQNCHLWHKLSFTKERILPPLLLQGSCPTHVVIILHLPSNPGKKLSQNQKWQKINQKREIAIPAITSAFHWQIVGSPPLIHGAWYGARTHETKCPPQVHLKARIDTIWLHLILLPFAYLVTTTSLHVFIQTFWRLGTDSCPQQGSQETDTNNSFLSRVSLGVGAT